MKRWLVIVCALFIAGVAPARAWCEATCIAPTEQGKSHCPSHEPADATTAISAAGFDECPVPESARPTVTARLEISVSAVEGYVPADTVRTYISPSSARPHSASTVFERATPLRI